MCTYEPCMGGSNCALPLYAVLFAVAIIVHIKRFSIVQSVLHILHTFKRMYNLHNAHS